jgi:aldehyde:ferredoxin oxidoreductase
MLKLKEGMVSMLRGYAGKILWINLTSGKIRVERLEEKIARKYLGGKGLGAYLLYSCLDADTPPYDPENKLIFVTGPLTGTAFPSVSRSAVITKSPMTGTFLDCYSGGPFGPSMKHAGFDAMVIWGKAKKPTYIFVDNEQVTLKDASHLWGLSTSETETRLGNELNQGEGKKFSIAAIGQAGERIVRFSSILNNKRAYGRGGPGAVMGSKNLKAIAVRGGRPIALADEGGFKETIKRCQRKISEHPLTKKGGLFKEKGTMMAVDLTQETGTFPTRNWQENTFAYAEEINGEAFSKHFIRPRACFLCPIGCSRETKGFINAVEYITEGPEYETIYSFGSNCEIKTPETIIAADKLCDDYGMDTISCGAVIGFAMECFEKGLISTKDTGGIALSFGDGEALIEVIHLIAKKQGIGQLLSEGVKLASEKIKGSAPFAVHVKGLELPGYDPRGMKGQALSYAISDRGGCHLRSNTLRTEVLGIPQVIDRYAYEGKAEMVREVLLQYTTFDCLISCIFGGFAISLKDYADGVSSVTGCPTTVKELRIIAERAWNLTRLFNNREGFRRKDDTLPERLFTETSTRGPSSGQVVDRASFEKMLDEYYQAMGWDKSTGIPTKEKLMELEIDNLWDKRISSM